MKKKYALDDIRQAGVTSNSGSSSFFDTRKFDVLITNVETILHASITSNTNEWFEVESTHADLQQGMVFFYYLDNKAIVL